MPFKHFAAIAVAFFVVLTLVTSSGLGRDLALTGNLYGFSDNLYAIAGLGFLVAYLYACRWPVAGLVNLIAVVVGGGVIIGIAVLGLPDHRIYGVDALLFAGWGTWGTYCIVTSILPSLKTIVEPIPILSRVRAVALGIFMILGAVALAVGVGGDVLKETDGSAVASVYVLCLLWGIVVATLSHRFMSTRPWA